MYSALRGQAVRSFFCLCCACSGPEAPPLSSAFANVSALRGRYPLIQRPTIQKYLDTLILDLSTRRKSAGAYEIQLFDSSRPFALSPAPGIIALSTGLILRCHTESELAFIIAHELAHHELKHVLQTQSESISAERSQQFELDADRFAVRAMLRAGINPLGSRDALSRFHQLLALEDARYPSMEERRQNIDATLALLPMIGTLDSRRFRELKDELQ